MPAAAIIPKPQPKAEEQLVPLKSGFKNAFIEKMCLSAEMSEEYDKFDSHRIRMRNKAIEIIEILNQDEIQLPKLQQIAFSGIPDCIKGLRPIVWRLILDELPTQTSKWQETLDSNYDTYEQFKKELIVKPKLQDEEEKKKQMQ